MKYQCDLQTRINIEVDGELSNNGLDAVIGKIEDTISKLGTKTDKAKVTVTNLGRGTVRKSEAHTANMQDIRESIRRKGL